MAVEQSGRPPLPPPPDLTSGRSKKPNRPNAALRWISIAIALAVLVLSIVSLVVRLTDNSANRRTVTDEDLAPWTGSGYNNSAQLAASVRASVLDDPMLLGKEPPRTLVNCVSTAPHEFTCIIDQGAEGGITTKSIVVTPDGTSWTER